MAVDDIAFDDWDDDGGAVPEPDVAESAGDAADVSGADDHQRRQRQLALLGVTALVVAVVALLMPRGR